MSTHSEMLRDRGLPLLVVVTLVALVAYSDVVLTLEFFPGWVTEVFMLVYAALLFVLAAGPNAGWLHRAGAPLAIVTFGGRAVGFVERAIETGAWERLLANAAERMLVALGLVLWHQARARELDPVSKRRKGRTEQWFWRP